jgi:hypothetical protein
MLDTLMPRYPEYIISDFEKAVTGQGADKGTVVAVTGAGSVFPFMKFNQVLEMMAPLVPGRLLILFPGSCESNNYRLLDAYDGWNYHAVPVTAGKEF